LAPGAAHGGATWLKVWGDRGRYALAGFAKEGGRSLRLHMKSTKIVYWFIAETDGLASLTDALESLAAAQRPCPYGSPSKGADQACSARAAEVAVRSCACAAPKRKGLVCNAG